MTATRPLSITLRRTAPNVVTFAAMLAGLIAIRCAIDDGFESAMIALALAGLADRLDGAVARLLRASSRFGAEFDSFADLVSFGLAPALVMYLWTLRPYGVWGFLPAVAYVLCAALRLARFNIAADTPRPDFARHFYSGLTSPPAAAIAVFPLLTWLEAGALHWHQAAVLAHAPVFAAAFLIGSGLLMISPFPLLDFVYVGLPLIAKLIVLAAFVVLLAVRPWAALMALTPFALLMLAISPAALRRRREAAGADGRR
jgi:CDP-diacylglycerol--serine O-phosphatidyltransferase